jgi:hypothetical protein
MAGRGLAASTPTPEPDAIRARAAIACCPGAAISGKRLASRAGATLHRGIGTAVFRKADGQWGKDTMRVAEGFWNPDVVVQKTGLWALCRGPTPNTKTLQRLG